jgi:hypothetical protein
MAKTIIIKLTSAGRRTGPFQILDDRGNVLANDVSKQNIIDGFTVSVADETKVIVIKSLYTCCNTSINVSIGKATKEELAAQQFKDTNTASLWRHLTNTTIYNKYYGCTNPYIIEYSFAFRYQDEILQNIKDYTKVYQYLPSEYGVFDDNLKVEIDNQYFDKSILYNGQQSSGVLKLVPKPINNLSDYMKYPIYSVDSKTITFTKSDNFYQYNTFWSLVRDKSKPLFISTCESLSIDKVVNQSNMDYSKRSFKKEPLRAKELKVRHILDSRSDVHLVSQFFVTANQISYK